MKPDWKNAPHWAKWLAQCRLGYWLWYEIKPVPMVDYGIWVKGYSRYFIWDMSAGKGDVNPNWQETLEQRPEEFEEVLSPFERKLIFPTMEIDLRNNSVTRTIPLKGIKGFLYISKHSLIGEIMLVLVIAEKGDSFLRRVTITKQEMLKIKLQSF